MRGHEITHSIAQYRQVMFFLENVIDITDSYFSPSRLDNTMNTKSLYYNSSKSYTPILYIVFFQFIKLKKVNGVI